MRTLMLLACATLFGLSAECRRATPSEVGAAERASASPEAEMSVAHRVSAASPQAVSPAAGGMPMREADVGGVPPAPVTQAHP